MAIFINILLVIHVIVSILIILVTLMQRPKNEGLGAAFGGSMTSDLFGAQTSNVLANFTRWLGGIFFGLTLLLSVLYARNSAQPSDIRKQLLSAPRVVATPTPAAVKSGTAAKPAGKPSAPMLLDTTKAAPKASVSPVPAAPAVPKTAPAPTAAATPAPTVVPAPKAVTPAATPAATVSPVTSGSK